MVLRMLGQPLPGSVGTHDSHGCSHGRMRSVDLGTVCFRLLCAVCFLPSCGVLRKSAGTQTSIKSNLMIPPEDHGDV